MTVLKLNKKKRYDSNHNGRLTKKELITMLNAMYDLKGLENRKGDNDPKGSKRNKKNFFNKVNKVEGYHTRTILTLNIFHLKSFMFSFIFIIE